MTGLAAALATAPFWKRRLHGTGWIDLPRPDRHATRPVSRAGGAAWLSGALGGLAAAAIAVPGAGTGARAGAFIGIVALVTVAAFALGRLDDRGRLGSGRKWVLQAGLLIAGMVALARFGPGRSGDGVWTIANGPDPASWPGWLAALGAASAAAVVLQVALEILDHLDGLLAVHAAAGAAALALVGGPGIARAVAFAGCGASLGFLWWNRPPARLYLGNAGSLALATFVSLDLFAAAWTQVGPALPAPAGLAPAHGASPDAAFALSGESPWRWLAALPALAWPLADLAVVTVARLRRGVAPWTGGRDHLAHRMARRLGSDGAAFGLSAAAAAAGFFIAATGLR